MTEPTWKYHTPERDGHAPDDWVEGLKAEFKMRWTCTGDEAWIEPICTPNWREGTKYRYRPLQDATYEPDLLAQCLRLPQDQREALIEAMQKPVRDWADDVAQAIWQEYISCNFGTEKISAVIRFMCRPKEDSQKLVEAAEAARVLIGSKNDGLTAAAKQANINQAWHVLNAAIREALS